MSERATKPRKPRRNKPMMITMPIDERVRLTAFAQNVGRPISWIVREALEFYLTLAERKVEQLRTEMIDDVEAAGRGAGLPDIRIPKAESRTPVNVG
jgi:predicted DNA-binding protein